MSNLYLIRHGQASFLAENYDKLSPLGEAQSVRLGEFWAQHHVKFDRTATGPCLRQTDTAKLVAAAYRQAGQTFPEPLILPQFDEYQAEAVLKLTLPKLLETDKSIAQLYANFQASPDQTAQRASFQKLFEIVIG